MNHSPVLIVGAGPTGLVLALWLTHLGVRVRIIDKVAQPGTTSRALAVQARTLELYRQLGLADAVFERAHKTPGVNLWVKGERTARIPFSEIGKGLTDFPFLLIFPQDQHERFLVERLQALGVSVERELELVRFEDGPDLVRATLRRTDGSEESCTAAYIAGCDGARSRVREVLGTGFPGGTYRQLFYVADVQAEGPTFDGELHVDLDEADLLAVFPLEGEGCARLIGTVRDERADHADTLRFDDVSQRAIEHLKVSVRKVNWFSTYRVHHRVTDQFRKGRAFLLGDAAHIHSPAGGQGMNTGIGDSINLAWKLAAVLSGNAADALLDSYQAERMPFARRLVATTDRAFSFAAADGHVAELVRTRLVPLLLPKLASLEHAREFAFRTVAQLTLNYRGGPLSLGTAGHVHGGDRLPWVVPAEGHDNYHWFDGKRWQVHVYGTVTVELENWCNTHALALHVLPWRAQYAAAGLAQDAAYLLRPDSYVALAADGGTAPRVIERFFSERRLRP
ncbi:MAG TPA: FAD-dependent monooxygenase [Polyangiales bacterium]|nr:FAD-dependent monooxygenase [Polyangiales bacterium]